TVLLPILCVLHVGQKTRNHDNYISLLDIVCRHCETHQMTGNYMWDEVSNKEFLIGTNPDSRLSLWWNGSEPLWVTLQNVGKNVFMYFWPGDKQTKWPENLSGQADMAAVYYEKIDVEGHHFGNDGMIVFINATYFYMEMYLIFIYFHLNVLLFSDHGMAKIQWMEKVIELDKFIDMSDVLKIMDRGPVLITIFSYKDLSILQVHNMRVYARQEIPERFHYRKGNFNKKTLPYWKNDSREPSAWQNGWHGYDNEFVDMRGFFLAVGPDFKQNVRGGSIRAVDVYNVMCWILGVDPLPNNGSWSRVEKSCSSLNRFLGLVNTSAARSDKNLKIVFG
uniref:glycerophosphocholine cholinephosphodiesterase n=1 Tax=Fundulus heteroclitus TaxID=8078 RepID=A0A3Q2QCE1_FUNHE